MFDSHQWSAESTRKRAREDDEALNALTGFTEHRNKRLHSLPLRTSPHQKRWSGPPCFPLSQLPPSNTVTPGDSDSEDVQHQHQTASHFSPWSSSPALSQHRSPIPPIDVDRDTDMMVMEDTHHLQPGPSQPDPIASSIASRMPTPIHATFASQVRRRSWGMTSGNNTHVSAMSGFARPFPPPLDPSVPRSIESTAEWSMVQNRRLPSPISESGGEEVPGSPGMILDSPSNPQHHCLLHLRHSTSPPSMAHPNVEIVTPRAVADDLGMMDIEEGDEQSPSSAPATPSPRSKFGHSRSKHTVNSWTLQPGMKKSFSIGYRADCEKCRLKIPGHFNHIIVS